jgi:tetratricopeptide (TPR) repeat protein
MKYKKFSLIISLTSLLLCPVAKVSNFHLSQAVAQEIISPQAYPFDYVLRKVDEVAKQVTVRILQPNTSLCKGSGVIIAQEGNRYTVLTAEHVIRESENCNVAQLKVITPDNQQYSIEADYVKKIKGADLAIITFSSPHQYKKATLGDYSFAPFSWRPGLWTFVSGYPDSTNNHILSAGRLHDHSFASSLLLDSRSFNYGYELVYDGLTQPGMSGGPVFDTQGNVIGIHGRAEGVINIQKKAIYLGRSLGVPIQTFLQGLDNIFINKEILKIETNHKPVLFIETISNEGLALQHIDKPDDNDYISWLNYGNQLWRFVPNHPDVVKAFLKAIELEPNSYEAWYVYGVSLNSFLGKFSPPPFLSINVFVNGVRQENEVSLDNASAFSGSGEENLKIFERVLELKPKFAPALYEKGRILAHLNRNEEALESLEEAVALEPNLVKAYHTIMNIYYQLNNKEGAIENAKKLIEIEPNNSELHSLLSGLFFLYKNYSEALKTINKSIEISPIASFYGWRARIYLYLEEYEKALTDADKEIKINPNSSSGYVSKADVYRYQGKYEEAIKAYNQALTKNPYSFDAIGGIGTIEYEQGNIAQAMEKWQKIIKADRGDNYTIIYGLARAVALHQQGKQEEAIKLAQKALRIIIKNPIYSGSGFDDLRNDFYLRNIWGEKLVADAEKLLDNTEIKAFLDNLK